MKVATTEQSPRQVLEEGLCSYFGRPTRIVAVEGEPLPTSSHSIDRLGVTLASGEQLPVIFKRLHPGEKLYGNEREVLIYRRLLAGRRFNAPALYASAYDETQGRYWLFLEDLGERTLKHAGLEEWLAAIRWLAEMHAIYLGREDELRALNCLRDHGAEYYEMIAQTARQNLHRAGAQRALARFDGLLARYDSLVAYLARQPRTLVHSDIFPSNLVIQPGPRVRPIDWESAAVGLPAWDLARLLDGWVQGVSAFIAAYRAELLRYTTRPFDWQAFQAAFGLCELLNILWHLRRDVEACRDVSFVNDSLQKIEAARQRLDEEGLHV